MATYSTYDSSGVYLDTAAQTQTTVTSTGTIVGNNAGQNYTGILGAASQAWTITNYGTIRSGNPAGYGIGLANGGVVTNAKLITGASVGVRIEAAAGTVTNTGTVIGGYDGVALTATTGLLVNSGFISGTKGSSYGAYLAGGTVTNSAAGIIRGYEQGLNVGRAAATVDNLGLIAATGTNGIGVSLYTSSTLTNAGTIAGGHMAVDLHGVNNLLVVDPGAVFSGSVYGGDAGGRLELASGSSVGTLTGLGTAFTDFPTMTVDGGAQWVLTGGNTLAGTSTLTVSGSLTLSGSTATLYTTNASVAGVVKLEDSAGMTVGAGLAVTSGGSLDLDSPYNNAQMTGASLDVTSNLVNSGTVSLAWGSVRGSGDDTVVVGGTLINDGTLDIADDNAAATTVTAAQLVDGGTIDLAGDQGGDGSGKAELIVTNGAAPAVLSTVITLSGPSLLEYEQGGGIDTIANTGTLLVAGSSAFVTDATSPNQNAELTGISDVAGLFSVANGATVALAGALTVTGFGTLAIDAIAGTTQRGAVLTVAGNLVNSGTVIIADNGGGEGGSTITVDGTMTNIGALDVFDDYSSATVMTVAALSDTGTIAVHGDAFGDGTGPAELIVTGAAAIAGTITVEGDAFFSAGSLIIGTGGSEIVQNGGTTTTPTISGGLLDLQAGGVVSGTIAFAGSAGGTLEIDGAAPANTIDGVGPTDEIDLRALTWSATNTVSFNSGTGALVVSAGGASDTLTLSGVVSGTQFVVTSDSGSGTVVVAQQQGGGITYNGTITTGIVLSNAVLQNPATLASGGYVTNQTARYSGDVVLGKNVAAWAFYNFGTIVGTAGAQGIVFTAGGYVDNALGGLIDGPAFGIDIQGGAGTVVNAAVISADATGAGVYLYNGGAVANTGTIAGGRGIDVRNDPGLVSNSRAVLADSIGVFLQSGGTLVNTVTGTISGTTGVNAPAAQVLVENFGTIEGLGAAPNGFGIANAGGRVVNGGNGLVENFGTIEGLGAAPNGFGIANAGGRVVNGGNGLIEGYQIGVWLEAFGGIVTNSGDISTTGTNGIGVEVEGGGGLVTNATPAAQIDGDDTGVSISDGTGTVVNLGTIAGTNVTGFQVGGVDLASGGLISNGAPGQTQAAIDGVYWGVFVGGGGTVVNYGAIAATEAGGIGIRMMSGGTIDNTGTIDGPAIGIFLDSTVTVSNGTKNSASGLIDGVTGIDEDGNVNGGPATVVNYATIAGAEGGSALVMNAGGVVDNFGTIVNTGSDSQAIDITSGTVENGSAGATTALIQAGSSAYGVSIGTNTTVVNFGTIVGGHNAVHGGGAPGTEAVFNSGVIDGAPGTGVYFASGGYVRNAADGLIVGGIGIARDAGTVVNFGTITSPATGVGLYSGSTLTNAGTIVGGTGFAVEFDYSNNRLVVDPGAVFAGGIDGDAGGGSNDVLELAAGASAGTIGGLGTAITGFGALAVDASAAWLLSGTNTLAAGYQFTDSGTLTFGGNVVNAGALEIAAGATVVAEGSITGAGTIGFGGAGASLAISGTTMPTNILSGLAPGDGIDLLALPYNSAVSASYNSTAHTLIAGAGAGSYTLSASGVVAGTRFLTSSDGHGGTFIKAVGMSTITTNKTAGVILQTPSYTNPVYVASGVSITNTTANFGGDAIYGQVPTAWTLTNYGDVSGTAGAAIFFGNAGTITNDATISAGGTAFSAIVLDASTIGTPARVVNSGLILNNETGTFGDGIQINRAYGEVTNTGTIGSTGGGTTGTGIIMGYGGSVDNSGSTALIVGTGTGVDFGQNGTGTVDNQGTIVGSVDGVSEALGGIVVNSGTIEANGPGTLSGWAVFLDAPGTVSNSGVILATAATFANAVFLNTGGALYNSGTLDAIGTNSDGVQLEALASPAIGWTAVNAASGLIAGQLDGIFANNAAGAPAGTVDNSGTIVGFGTNGVGVQFAYGGLLQNYSTGLITGAAAGFDFGGTPAVTLVNSGTIAATGAGSVAVSMFGTGATTIANHGTIIDTSVGTNGNAIALSHGGSITNSGLIADADVNNAAIGANGVPSTIVNSGTIAATGQGNAISFNVGGTLTNTGSVTAAGTNSEAVAFSAAAGLITNGVKNQTVGLISAYHYGVAFFPSSTISNPGTLTIVNYGTIQSTQNDINNGALGGRAIVDDNANTGLMLVNFGKIENAQTQSMPGTIAVGGGIVMASGVVINEAGASITAQDGNGISVSFITGAGVTITNFGTISSTDTNHSNVYIGRGGGTITNAGAAALIEGARSAISFGTTGGIGIVVNSGTIRSTSATAGSGVYLGDGGTITNEVGGLISGYDTGVSLKNVAGEVSNSGTIAVTTTTTSSGEAAYFGDGGLLLNSGLISGTRNGSSGSYPGVVEANNEPMTVVNTGTIFNPNNSNGVNLLHGGALVNGTSEETSALIEAPRTAIYMGGRSGTAYAGATGYIYNFGTIENTTTASSAISLAAGGTIVNHGLILSPRSAVAFDNTAGTIDNFGTIASTAPTTYSHAAGAYLQQGGLITNNASGTIAAYRTAVVLGVGNGNRFKGSTTASATLVNLGLITGSVGVSAGIYSNAPNTVTNSGTILGTGAITGDAVNLRTGGYLNNSGQISGVTAGVNTGAPVEMPVFSTGDGSQVDGFVDPHWTYTNSSDVSSGALVASNPGVDFWTGSSPYAPNSSASAWVDDNTDGESGGLPYSFATTFSLSGLNVSTAFLTGLWGAADGGDLELNGHIIATLPDTGSAWSTLHSFSIDASSGDFVAGTNTLSVVLTGADGSFDGTDVEVTGSAMPTAAGTVSNTGTIVASGTSGVGVNLQTGGTLANSGLIVGYAAGVSIGTQAIGIFSTGDDSTIDGTGDLHWSFTNSSGITDSALVANNPGVDFWNGSTPWAPDTASSSWIVDNTTGPQSGGDPLSFSTTFDLTGYDVTTATLSGMWAVDDEGELELNGHVIAAETVQNDWETLQAFSVNDSSGYFVAGVNTLTVVLTYNDNNFEGTNVEVTGTAVPSSPAVGTVTNTGTIVGTGDSGIGVVMAGNETLVNDGTIVGASGTAVSMGTASEFVIDQGSVLDGVITNVQSGDVFDLPFLAYATGATANLLENNVLEVSDSNGSYTIDLDPNENLSDDQFVVAPDTGSGSDVQVSSTSNSSGFSFSDNFTPTASSAWNNYFGNWTASGGDYLAQQPQFSTFSGLPFDMTNLSLTVTINDEGDSGIWLHSDGTGQNGVLLVIGGESYGQGARGGEAGTSIYWVDVRDGGADNSANLDEVSGVFTPGDTYTITVTVTGDTYAAYVDGATTPVTTLTDDTFTSGTVGLYDDQPNDVQGSGSGSPSSFSDFSLQGNVVGSVYTGTITSGIVLSNPTTQNPTTLGTGSYVTNNSGAYGDDAVFGKSGTAWVVSNYGTVNAPQSTSHAINLADGGTVTNGNPDGGTNALIEGSRNGVLITGASGTIDNFGTIASTAQDDGFAAALCLADGGVLVNGAPEDTTALITSYNPSTYAAAYAGGLGGTRSGAAGTFINYGSIIGTGNGDSGVELASGGNVTNETGGTISGAVDGVLVTDASGSIANYGAIVGNGPGYPEAGIALDAGGIVTNATGGLIASEWDGVHLAGGGTIDNSGTIVSVTTGGASGVALFDGGYVFNAAGALISGGNGIFLVGVAGTVVNDGTVAATVPQTSGDEWGVYLRDGGVVVNGTASSSGMHASPPGALITAYGDGVYSPDGSATVVNYSTITSTYGIGIDLAEGGAVTNATGGLVVGFGGGIYMFSEPGTVSNYGTVVATDDDGVYLGGGGLVTNSGLVVGAFDGVDVRNSATVVNSGTLVGGGYGDFGGIFILGDGPFVVSNSGTIVSTAGGVLLNGTGSVSNAASAFIQGGYAGVLLGGAGTIANYGTIVGASGIGVELTGSYATLVNAGVVAGTSVAAEMTGSDDRVVDEAGAVFAGAILFGGTSNTLEIDGTSMPANTISGFTASDTIDLHGIVGGDSGSVSLGANNVLTVTEDGQNYALQLDPSQSFAGDTFLLSSDAAGGTDVTLSLSAQSDLFDFLFQYNDSSDYYEGMVAGNYTVGEPIETATGTYTIFNEVGTTPDPSGTVFVTDYSHDGPGLVSEIPIDTAAGQPDGTGGLGSENDALLGTDGLDHAFNDTTPISLSLNSLYGFEFSYADGGDFYTGTVADDGSFGVTPGTRTVTNASGQVVGTYTIFADGETAEAAGTVNVDRFFLDGQAFIPTLTAAGVADGHAGLGSESDAITVNGATAGFTDQSAPSVSLTFPTVTEPAAPPATTVYQSEVDDVFQDVLGRSPSSGELTTYTNELAGGTSVATITQTLANSSEAQGDLNTLYQDIFGQGIDPTDDATDTSLLADGSSLTSIEAMLGQSPQAQADIEQIYQNVLNSAADGQGLADAMATLSDGGNIAGVQSALAHSSQAAADLTVLFQNAESERSPDAAELAGMEDQLGTLGASQSSVVPEQGFTLVTPGSGTQTLTAVSGTPTEFDFSSVSFANDIINGFDVTQDAVRLSTGLAGSFPAVEGDISNDDGSALITFNASQSILLNGVAPGNLSAANFHFVAT